MCVCEKVQYFGLPGERETKASEERKRGAQVGDEQIDVVVCGRAEVCDVHAKDVFPVSSSRWRLSLATVVDTLRVCGVRRSTVSSVRRGS